MNSSICSIFCCVGLDFFFKYIRKPYAAWKKTYTVKSFRFFFPTKCNKKLWFNEAKEAQNRRKKKSNYRAGEIRNRTTKRWKEKWFVPLKTVFIIFRFICISKIMCMCLVILASSFIPNFFSFLSRNLTVWFCEGQIKTLNLLWFVCRHLAKKIW